MGMGMGKYVQNKYILFTILHNTENAFSLTEIITARSFGD